MIDKQKQDAIAEAVAAFERDNQDVLEAARIFGISNEEYQKALIALEPRGSFTSASTQEGEHALMG